jgi:hypothetical protein
MALALIVSNRNECQGYLLGLKVAEGLINLMCNCLEFLVASTSWSSKGLFGPVNAVMNIRVP